MGDMNETERAKFWEDTAKNYRETADYYQQELAKAHEILGRVIHQFSERWDNVNLTEFFPTNNLHGKRTMNNPSGKEQERR